MTRKLFLTLMITFTILNIGYSEISIRRVNDVSDKYLDQLMRNSALIGCVFPTGGDYDYCSQMVQSLDWSRLGKDLKRVSKETK